MLEFWYKDKRTLADFRRGLLGPHFDSFAAYLQANRVAEAAKVCPSLFTRTKSPRNPWRKH